VTDELRNRLSRLDPVPPEVVMDPVTSQSSQHLLEEIMSQETTDLQPEPVSKGKKAWYAAVAAAALVIVVIGAVGILSDGGEDPVASGPPLELSAGTADPSMTMCIMYSVEELAKAPVAFEGTVTSVEGETVTLDVDHWFKGGDAEQVVIDAPAGMEALLAGIPFEEGTQYLVTAYDGTVNYCGFSGPSTPEFRADFEEAFGS
jgi:hypothetical protein